MGDQRRLKGDDRYAISQTLDDLGGDAHPISPCLHLTHHLPCPNSSAANRAYTGAAA